MSCGERQLYLVLGHLEDTDVRRAWLGVRVRVRSRIRVMVRVKGRVKVRVRVRVRVRVGVRVRPRVRCAPRLRVRRAHSSLQLTTYYSLHTAYLLLATYYLLLTTYYSPPRAPSTFISAIPCGHCCPDGAPG